MMGKNKRRSAVALVVLLVAYLGMSFQTGSIFFWKWRDFHFDMFEIISSRQDWGVLKINRDLEGQPIRLQGVQYAKGLSTHANSEIIVKLKKPSRRISGVCGYPDSKSKARIQCQIRSRGRILFTGPVLDEDNRRAPFSLNTEGESEFVFMVRSMKDNIDFAHAVWVDLRGLD